MYLLDRETNRKRQRKTETERQIYYKKWAHGITETKKSHNLLSANGKPRKAGDVGLVQVQKPENQESQ